MRSQSSVGGDFSDSIGAGRVVVERVMRDITAEFCHHVRDARVVGGDEDGVDISGGGGATINMLDHGPPGDVFASAFPGKRVDP